MLTLNNRIKSFLTENCGVKADASDTDFRKAAGAALAEGGSDFTYEKYLELSASDDEDDEPKEKDGDAVLKLLEGLTGRFDKVEDRLKTVESGGSKSRSTNGHDPKLFETPEEDGDDSKNVKSRFEQMMTGTNLDNTKGPMLMAHGAHKDYASEKAAAHFPATTNRDAKHPFAGQRAFEGGGNTKRFIDNPSEQEQAIIGAWSKFMIQSQLGDQCPRQIKCTEHEMSLVQYALAHCKWAGVIGGVCDRDEGATKVKNRTLREIEVKAILDDAVSGAIEITPIFFDDAVILDPILFGEFAPRVNMVPITRGRRIEGGIIGNVTLGPSTEGTAIPLFNTAGFIAAFDTTIFVVAGAIEIGLDELSDTPIDIGGIITGQYGRKLLEWLDRVICNGTGVNEPEGIVPAAGTVAVNFAGAAATVGGYESLLFGIAKRFKQGYDRSRIIFGGTETSYQRSRGIAVGAADARRVFGLNQENYMLFGHTYGINEDLANTEIFFGNLGRYRMYRRMGLTFNVTRDGKELVLANQMLLSCRARFGGQIEDGNAFAVVNDGQA